jgi:hypothetical protein
MMLFRTSCFQWGPILAATLFVSTPVFAQEDFSGSWSPLFHEDLPDRIPGPEWAIT